MKVNPIINLKRTTTFKGATLNINAISDTHGEIKSAGKALEYMRENKRDFFCYSNNSESNKNIFVVNGDWFMDGAKKGYLSDPERPLASFQLEMLNGFISEVKKLAPNMTALFTPGNHEFDMNLPEVDKILSGIDAKVIMSNLDAQNSPLLSKTIENNLVSKYIEEIPDDKNPNMKHKVMFLGVSPVNIQYYYQGNMEGVEFFDNVNAPQFSVKREDYEKTLAHCKKEVEDFKQQNPDGVVVLLSHTGVNFADTMAKESNIDLVLDGHEHKRNVRYLHGTPIVPLYMNFKQMANARLHFDDEGNHGKFKISSYNPLLTGKKGPLDNLYNKIFTKDLEPKYSITSDDMSVSEFGIYNVRKTNNQLANFVTDSVLDEIRKYEPDTDFFAINASAIRHPLKISDEKSVSNFDVKNVLAGIKENEASVFVGLLTGEDVAYCVLQNLIANSKDSQKNPITHYAGMQIDKKAIMEAYNAGFPVEYMTQFIIDERTGKSINPDMQYKVAVPEKFFIKSKDPRIKELKKSAEKLPVTVPALFLNHFENSNGTLHYNSKIRIKD